MPRAEVGDGQESAVDILRQYLRIDTSNPPGNERAAVLFLSSLLERHEIPWEILGENAERPNLFAWLDGKRSHEAILLVNHMDVVPADRTEWVVDPFGAEIRDGCIFGRGALDMKSLAVAQLFALLSLRSRSRLRPVFFMALADEECGSRLGADWVTRYKSDLLGSCGLCLTEGGGNRVNGGEIEYFGIVVTEKTPCWLRLEARGTGGHASKPSADSAIHRLVRALHKILEYETPVRILPSVEEYFRRTTQFEDSEVRLRVENVSAALADATSREWVLSDKIRNALVRNTVIPTVIETTCSYNVIPSRASAILDCRLLPGEEPRTFVEELRSVVGTDGIELTVERTVRAPRSTGIGPAFRRLEKALKKCRRKAKVVPCLLPGSTDARFFRALGIECLGFSPFALTPESRSTVHAQDEHISVETFQLGVELYVRVVEELVNNDG